MNFNELLADSVYEFLFIFTPLRLKGATGSPGRPINPLSAPKCRRAREQWQATEGLSVGLVGRLIAPGWAYVSDKCQS